MRYVSVLEQHRNGWPHVHALLESPALMDDLRSRGSYPMKKDRKGRSIWRWNRQVLVPILQASGFGPIAHSCPPDSLEATAGYLIKLSAELTGTHHKQDQTPLRAPKGFRRLRATPGILPRRTDFRFDSQTGNFEYEPAEGDWTGVLVKVTQETIQKAADGQKFAELIRNLNGKDSKVPRVWGSLRPPRIEAAPESQTRDRIDWRGMLFTGSETSAFTDPEGG